MDPLICPNPSCGSADIRQTTTGLFRNSYICNKCSRPFARLAGANIVMPTVPPTLLALGAGIKNIIDSLDGSSKKSGRPPQPTRPPARHHQPGAVPPRPHPGVAPPPRQHTTPPPVHGHNPPVSPRASPSVVGSSDRAIGQERSTPSSGPHAGSPPRP
jgi:hypothetical protein